MCTLIKLIIFISIIKIDGKIIEIQCPEHCVCDLFENYRRAQCMNQKLTMIDADIPMQVQLLDVSFNQIHELPDHIFMDLHLTELKLLNMSHNNLNQVHMNAFTDLTVIKTIDLSYNNLEYALVNWFWNIPTLDELYLNNNKFGKLNMGPLIESKSLKILDISNCNIPYIPEETFSKLPSLVTLDISGNFLIGIKTVTIKPLSELTNLKLNNNSWKCDDAMMEFNDYCTVKGIKLEKPCQIVPKEEKFQRMMKLEQEIESKNSWIINDNLFEKNGTTLNNTCTVVREKNILRDIIELSPILTLVITFTVGLTLGLIIACNVHINLPKMPPRKIPYRRSSSIIRSRQMQDNYDLPLICQQEFSLSETTPIPLRKNTFM